MNAIKFRVRNYRNIDDSDWIELEKVTAFVGCNESGKTSLLKALHKFNPATPESYDVQREFPRDRYTRDYVANGEKGEDWPVCSVEFEIGEAIRGKIGRLIGDEDESPENVTVTRYYDGSIRFAYTPEIEIKPLGPKLLLTALESFAAKARRLRPAGADEKEATDILRRELLQWAREWKERIEDSTDLRKVLGTEGVTDLSSEADDRSGPNTANMVEALQRAIKPVLNETLKRPVSDRIDELIEEALPVFIYFENYGILDSAIWLPRLVEDLKSDPNNSRVRTANAMFGHVGLDPREIAELGDGEARKEREQGNEPTSEQIKMDQRRVEERAIKLSSASNDISTRFSNWWKQRRHKIRYHADGEYFRIWIADDRRPDVEIELEGRSKGFQWFFSFYLVFLVESSGGHKDAILLLDEPGLHLHPSAQQELISFFEQLSGTNQLAYTTHSPFLIDGEHLHRVRPVTEDSTGHSRITVGTWPSDRETIFPLQAAAGYAMIRGLFQHHKNVLVEGMTDFYYLNSLSQQCARSGRSYLPEGIHITPCGGTKHVGHFASLFLSHKVRPVVLLDGDDAGRARKDALIRELYVDRDSMIVMLDDVLCRSGDEIEIEDIIGAKFIVPALVGVLQRDFEIDEEDLSSRSLPTQVKVTAKRQSVTLPEGWKASVALHLVSAWAEERMLLPDEVLDAGALVFSALAACFETPSS